MQNSSQFNTAIHICIFMHFKQEELISSQTIAESVGTNPVVIRRIIAKLRNRGIIDSVAGAKGGFFLSKSASQISLWDIYEAVKEQNLFPRTRKINPDCVVSSNLSLLVRDVYDEAELAMKQVFEKVSIEALTHKLGQIITFDENNFR